MRQFWEKPISTWKMFFFEPTSPATLGLYRIVFGFVVFLSNLGHFPSRDIFYGQNGIVRYETVGRLFPAHLPQWLFFRWLPQTEPELKYYFIGLLIVNVLFIFGLFSRLSSVLLFIGVISLSNRNPFNENAGDLLIRSNLFLLMFTNAGSAYSLDRYFGKKRGRMRETLEPISPWVQRLLQMQLAYVYVDTVYLKLEGESWRDGTAMYYALNYLELRRFNLRFLFYNLWLVKLATYGTLLAESSVGILIWFKKFRYWMIGAAIALHEGINLSMQFPVFQYVMMSSLLIFVYPKDAESIVNKLLKLLRKPPIQAPLKSNQIKVG